MKFRIFMLAILVCAVTAMEQLPNVEATTLGAYAEWYYDTPSPINVPNGSPISFPYDGQVKGSYMSRVNDNMFRLLYPGTYLVQFDIVPTTNSQLGVKVSGVPQPQCVVGNYASTLGYYYQLNGFCIITTTSISSTVQVYNPSGSTISIKGKSLRGTNNQGRLSILALSGIYSEQNITSPVFGHAHFYSSVGYKITSYNLLLFPTTSVISGGIQKISSSVFRLLNKGRYLIMYRLTGEGLINKQNDVQVCLSSSSQYIVPGSCNGRRSDAGQLINAVIYQSTVNGELISLLYTGESNTMDVPRNPGGSSIVANSLIIIQLSNPLDSDVNDFDTGFFYTSQPPTPVINVITSPLPLTSGSGSSMSLVNGNSVKLNNAGYYMILMQTSSNNDASLMVYIGSSPVNGSRGTRITRNNSTYFVPIIIRTTSANSVVSMRFLDDGSNQNSYIYQSIGGFEATGPSMVVWRIA